MKQRIGFERWSSRSLVLARRGTDPRPRRDAQRGIATGVRLDTPITLNRRGQVALNLPATGPLRVVKGKLILNPAQAVSSLQAGSDLAQVTTKLNDLLTALRAAGLLQES